MNVTIENFQSIAKAALRFTGLSVIIGPSNHGKSAVLRAIEGALFNMPGEYIVRKGAKNAVVSLATSPNVTWTKGAANKYTIDGVDYARVGSAAPQPLQDAGYRDVWVGDTDKKKGESLRPQVASQFEPLFLLTRTGSFLSDVLGLMSRHHIVATAQDRCAGDLRASKQRLGVRTGDRQSLDQKLTVLDVPPVLMAEDRQRLGTLVQRVQRHDVVLRHRDQQARLRAVPSPRTAPIVPLDVLLKAAVLTVSCRDQLARRGPYQRVLASPLPTPGPTDLDALLNPARAIAGVKRRRLLARVTAPSDAPFPAVHTGAVDGLRTLVAQRRVAMDTVYQTQQAAKATGAEVETATLLLEGALQSMGACPVCGRPPT